MSLSTQVADAIQLARPADVKAAYLEVFKKNISTGCSDCISDAIIELKVWLKRQQEEGAKINLITLVYKAKTAERQKELDYCLLRNKTNPYIYRVIKVGDRGDKRPTFDDLFSLTWQYPEDINIIANSDIYFDDTIKEVRAIRSWESYALARYDILGDGTAKHIGTNDSQDAWIIRGAARNIRAPFAPGLLGCDNRLAYELERAKYRVSNPSLSIRAFHYHLSGQRNYIKGNQADTVGRPYKLIGPSKILC